MGALIYPEQRIVGYIPLGFLEFVLDLAAVNANGVLHASPPIKPRAANCHRGSDPDEPKTAPKTGLYRVR